MQPLRISFFTSYVHEQGTYFRYHNLAAGLVRLGQEVTVYGCDVARGARKRSEVRDGVRYEIVPESWKASVFSQFNHPLTTMRRGIRSYLTCDIKHVFQPFLGAAAAWGKCSSQATFYDWDDQWTDGLWHGPITSWRERWPRFITRHLEQSLPRKADHTTVVGDYLATLATSRGARRVSVLHNGFNSSPLRDRTQARVQLGLQPNALYVGTMGSLPEIDWCFRGIKENASAIPNLRFAICGPPKTILDGLHASVRERVDCLGHISHAATREFAASLDLGLLPLDDTPFNRSRFPIKFCEHLASGNPLLCSEVGEVGRLAKQVTGVIPAGMTQASWLSEFRVAVNSLAKGDRPRVDLGAIREAFSWDSLSHRLLRLYRHELGQATDDLCREQLLLTDGCPS